MQKLNAQNKEYIEMRAQCLGKLFHILYSCTEIQTETVLHCNVFIINLIKM